MKLQKVNSFDENVEWFFYCRGCEMRHLIRSTGSHPCWTWNGDRDKPTFSPSYLIHGMENVRQCHSFIADGKIQYLADCQHALANQTIDLPNFNQETGDFEGEE